MGAPGSGKGTQSSLLASRLEGAVLSTGAMLREEAKRNTPSGFRLRQTLANGEMVSDAIVCDAVAERMRAPQTEGLANRLAAGGTLILDGFPRTVGQAHCLDRLLEGLGMAAPLVLHLVVPKEILLRRLARRRQCAKCGAIYNLASGPPLNAGTRCRIDGGALVERDDDSEGVVARRIAAYESETIPVVDYYRRRDRQGSIYRGIDGNRGAADIAKDLCDILSSAGAAGTEDAAVAA